MPWKECTVEGTKLELVIQMKRGGVPIAELCRRQGVSRKTAYKWLRRYETEGESGLREKSRKPRGSPGKTGRVMEERIVKLRKEHGWGGKKLRKLLEAQSPGEEISSGEIVPSTSTITQVLHRHGMIDEKESEKRGAWQRFEKEHPNEMWQMDFKGHFEWATAGAVIR